MNALPMSLEVPSMSMRTFCFSTSGFFRVLHSASLLLHIAPASKGVTEKFVINPCADSVRLSLLGSEPEV